MTPLPEVARVCGYEIISNRAQTVMELSGLGNWDVFELACRQFVKRTHNGHSYDHVSVIYRHADGKRTLMDVGVNDVRHGELPSVGFKYPRNTIRHERHPHDFSTDTPGVYARGDRFLVRAHHRYVATFDTYPEAVCARMLALKEVPGTLIMA